MKILNTLIEGNKRVRENNEAYVSKFWHGTHKLSNEYERIYDKYVPRSGYTDKKEINIFISLVKIIYDFYNNGGGNNKSQELMFLHANGYLKQITIENLQNQEYENFGKIFDLNLIKIINIIIDIEQDNGSFTKMNPSDMKNYGITDSIFFADYDDEYNDDDDDYYGTI